MRILMLLEVDFPPDNRVEKEALSLIDAGHEVDIACYTFSDRPGEENFKGIRLYRKHLRRAIKDSYTPQSLKVQVLSLLLAPVFVVMAFYDRFWLYPLSLIAVSFCCHSIPFLRSFHGKGRAEAAVIPLLLFLRALYILLGMVFGAASELRKGG